MDKNGQKQNTKQHETKQKLNAKKQSQQKNKTAWN